MASISPERIISSVEVKTFAPGAYEERSSAGSDTAAREARGIFPFQEEADVIFNSALVYEPAVLRVFAERFLLEVPREHPAYTEAYRLLKFLGWFVPVFPDEVPHTSILREFIGGSAFED